MKLIDKDALVAEIEKLISNGQVKLQESQESKDYESYVAWSEHIATCIKILSLIDTLEVKEVDLDKEIKDYFNNQPIVTRFKGTDYKLVPNAEKIAKHFYELGLKLQKEE